MEGSRIFGLDVLRAAAILLVVFWHSYDVITYLVPGLHAPFFLDGVDLFFVLSGYLIGGILLSSLRKPGLSGWQRLQGFWLRRFFRTLPNYYLFLLVNIALLWWGIGPGLLNHNALAYFVFLQDAWKPVDLFFWESWSLVVEIWFYILFPVLLFTCLGLLRLNQRAAFLITVAIFLASPLIIRFVLAPGITTIADGELTIRRLAITRVDTIVYGVAAALMQARFGGLWHRLRWPLFLLGCISICVVPLFYTDAYIGYSATWYYSFNALAMTCLLPLMSAWRTGPIGGGVVDRLSKWSYALYFVHMPVRALLEPYYDPSTSFAGWLQLAVYWTVCLVLAWSVYRFYEKPMMDLRERFVRS